MKIICLTENTAVNRCTAEHGLSLYVDIDGVKLLFDMGQTDLFAKNAEKMNIDLSETDIAVLSHGHYDHGGGLGKFLDINGKAPVYMSRYAFMPHYNGTEKYIGLDVRLCENPRIIFTDDKFGIDSGIMLMSAAEDITGKFTDAGLTLFEGGAFAGEDFRHEQYLEINENGRKVLFSGCSHRGITNIVKQFCPDVLVGGFHLSKMNDEDELREYARFLDGYDTDYYTCHCTGENQYYFLKQYMKRLEYIRTGDVIIL